MTDTREPDPLILSAARRPTKGKLHRPPLMRVMRFCLQALG